MIVIMMIVITMIVIMTIAIMTIVITMNVIIMTVITMMLAIMTDYLGGRTDKEGRWNPIRAGQCQNTRRGPFQA